MKCILALCLLLIAAPILAQPLPNEDVVITIKQAYPAACPPLPDPPLTKNEDGTYNKSFNTNTYTVACWHTDEWKEVWTALPEDGGRFVRRVPRSKSEQ